MRMPRFLRVEAASMVIRLVIRPDIYTAMAPWPLPDGWTEEQTEEFFFAFNAHHRRIDEEATKRGHPLVSRAVNFKNVSLFLASLMLKEASYEAQLEMVQKSLILALGTDLKAVASIKDLNITAVKENENKFPERPSP